MKAARLLNGIVNTIGFPFLLSNKVVINKKKVQPPGELISVNGRLMHAIITGSENSTHTVVLDAGLSCCSLDWVQVQPEISKFAKVISFDRAGYGWSERSKSKYTSKDVVGDLKALLDSTSPGPPYILVGHSFGSLNMRLFASIYPELVVALVLIDGVHENRYLSAHWDSQREMDYKRNLKLYQFGYITSGIGLPRLIGKTVGRRNLPGDYQKFTDFANCQPKSYEAIYKEFLYSRESAQQVANTKPIPKDLPVTVISSNNLDPTWGEHQQLLCQLSCNTEFIKTDNGHSIHLENPELVIDAIRNAVNKVEEGIK